MRKWVKLISFILTLSMLLSCVAFAAYSTKEAVDYSGYIKLHKVLTCLDIVKDTDLFASEYMRDITEDEFNKLISNLIGMDYTQKCPGEFSFNRALQKVVDLMGYDLKVQTVGPYPAAYILVATKLGILEGLTLKGNQPLSVGDAMLLLFNSLDKDLLLQTIYGDKAIHEIVEGETLLSLYKKVYFAEGIMTDNAITNFYGVSTLKDGQLEIDGVRYEGDNTEYSSLIGRRVGVYYRVDAEGYRHILYLEDITNTSNVLTVTAGNVVDCKDLIFTYYTNDRTNKISISPSSIIIYNNIATIYEDSLFTFKSGEVTFIDNNNDATYDVITIKSYSNMIIRAITATDMGLRDLNDSSKDIFLKDMEGKYIVRKTNGEEVAFDYFKTYDVLSVAKAKNNEFIEIIISNKFASGVIERMYFNATENTVVIGGETYKVDSEYTTAANDMETGMYGKALLDFEGDIVFFADESTNDKYGYIIDGRELNRPFETVLAVKLLTEENSIDIYEFNESVIVNEVPISDIADLKTALYDEGVIKPQLIRYQLNHEGKICILDTAMDVTQTTQHYTAEETVDGKHLRLYRKSVSGTYLSNGASIDAKMVFDSKAKVFVVSNSNTAEDSDFMVLTTSSILNGLNQAAYDAYTTDAECLNAEVLVTTTDITSTLSFSSRTQACLIQEVGQTIYNGEIVDLIYAIQGGSNVEIPVNKKFASAVSVLPGDVARIDVDGNGMAVKSRLVYRKGNTYGDSGVFNSYFYAVSGCVYNYSQGIIQLSMSEPASLLIGTIPADSRYFKDIAPIYIWDSSVSRFKIAEVSDIKSFKHDNLADTVTVLMKSGAPVMFVIYR